MRSFVVIIALCVASASVVASGQSDENLTIVRSYVNEYGFDSFLRRQTSEVRKRLPLQISEYEYISQIVFDGQTKIQIIRHTLMPGWVEAAARLNHMPTSQVRTSMPNEMKRQVISTACSVPSTKFLLSKGLEIRHTYYESDGGFLFMGVVTARSCSGV